MTIDGSNDDQIHLSGIANYSFSDKDCGEPGDDSELEGADVEDEDEADVPEEEDPENDDYVSGVRKGKERSGAGGAAGGVCPGCRRMRRRKRSYGVMMMMSALMTQLMLPPWLQPLVQLARLIVLRLFSSVPSLTWRTGRSSTN